MLDGLNRLRPPLRYAVLLGVAAPAGRFLGELLGLTSEPLGPIDYLLSAVFGALGGAIAGYFLERRGKT